MSIDHTDIDEEEHSPRGAAVAAEVAAVDGEWERLEQAGLLLVSLARRYRDEERMEGES